MTTAKNKKIVRTTPHKNPMPKLFPLLAAAEQSALGLAATFDRKPGTLEDVRFRR